MESVVWSPSFCISNQLLGEGKGNPYFLWGASYK